MTANDLSKKFLLWFQQNNPDARIYRNNAGCFKTLAGSWVRYGIPNKGGSDYIAFVPKTIEYDTSSFTKENISDGYYDDQKILTVQFYEIKTIKDKMSKDQIKFANMIKNMGGEYFIVHEKRIPKKNTGTIAYQITENPYFHLEKWSVK